MIGKKEGTAQKDSWLSWSLRPPGQQLPPYATLRERETLTKRFIFGPEGVCHFCFIIEQNAEVKREGR